MHPHTKKNELPSSLLVPHVLQHMLCWIKPEKIGFCAHECRQMTDAGAQKIGRVRIPD